MLNIEGVINPVSFGFITNGLLKEFFSKKVDFNFLPIHNNLDWSVFSNESADYKNYVNTSAGSFLKSFNINDNGFKIWHIDDSWRKLSKSRNSLLTFHELDSLTAEETNILNSYDQIFVTSRFSKNVFEDCGVSSKVVYVPMGVDNSVFYSLNKPRQFKDTIVFSIFGKFEKRKRHLQTIQAWIKKYGNDIRYKLHLYITNPFFKPEQMNQVYAQIFNNQPKPLNVDLFPYLPTNAHLNDAYNITDIVIDMSGGESISLGSLNCIAMGKHGVVHWNSGIKDWATEDNAVLVKPNGKEPVYDGVFFHPNQKFNQGNIYTYDTDAFLNACDVAINKFNSNPVNEKGKELQNTYNFKIGAETILKEI